MKAAESGRPLDGVDDPDDLADLIGMLWRRHLLSFRSQADVVAAWREDGDAASASAHRLAGSLGSYGLAAGSVVAARIEALLGEAQPTDPVLLDELAGALRSLVDGHAAARHGTAHP